MDQARPQAQNGDFKKDLPSKTAVYEHVQKYAKPCSWTAAWWLIQTMALWGVLNAAAFFCPNYWMATIVAGLMSLVRLRLFILYHDMGHNSFFGTDKLNQRVGYFIGSFVLGHSFSYWVRGHNYHHKNANNLDKKLFAQTAPWSIEQYQKAPRWQRMLYTTVYGWPFLITACPLYFIFLQFVVCTWAELLGILCTWSFAIWMGPVYLYCRAVSTVVAASLGIIFFHVQHTFDNPYRRHNHNWDYFETAMKGSSFFMVPGGSGTGRAASSTTTYTTSTRACRPTASPSVTTSA
eukprot:CAMPEP_0196666544 /NCGR_PEP_ID=MMETSP1086-20130531/64576_1 /TAXON_ID=77921 /ORGANISM="Cyanoptyche  gloeocystis , Strain SAG4.97" /LENGTH=291 /DNA_ID=CAMNT_0042003753 /DNA_START=100 /DNA_END=976 /DNA_ORIENTATION=-